MAGRKKAPTPTDQPAANAERGEDEIELGGATYRLRPSHEANQAIEKQTGYSLVELFNRGAQGAISLEHLGLIAANWIKAGAEDENTRHVGAKTISELIYEAGQVGTMVKLTTLLNEAITGGRTISGERVTASE